MKLKRGVNNKMINNEGNIYKLKYNQALRMMRVENWLILFFISLSVFFAFLGFQWGVGICNLLLIGVVFLQLYKVNKKLEEEKEIGI
jgi:hypothetical protein